MTSKRIGKRVQRPADAAELRKPALLASPLKRFLLAAVALCGLIGIAYSNSVDNGFVWDDHQQIVMNPYLKPGAPLAPLFMSDVRFAHENTSGQTKVYRPLQLLTYRLLIGLSGDEPGAFHLCNLFFAAAGALAAFAVFWMLIKQLGLAFAAAALFAVHPTHTEAVDWIASLPDLGVGLFTLLAFAFFLAGRTAPRGSQTGPLRRLFAGLPLLSFATALLWKETAAVFPVLIGMYFLVVERGSGGRVRKALTGSAPYWAVLFGYLVLRFRVLGSLTAGPRDWGLSTVQLVLTLLHLMLSYWGKLALPLGLNAYHVFHPIRSISDPRALLTIAFSGCAVAGLVFLVRRAPLCGFAALWVCVTLLPALNINGLGRNPFAERYLYLPSAGFCLLVVIAGAWLVERVPRTARRPAGAVLVVIILAGYAAETMARNADWKDDSTLFTETLKHSPDAPFVRIMVASAQTSDSTQSTAAEQNYLQAVALAQQELPPDRLDTVIAYEGLASLYADRAQYDHALQVLAQAREMDPNNPDLAGEEGTILAGAGRGGASEALLQRSLAAQPNNENILSALGLIARDVHHDLPGAAAFFEKALSVHPENDDFSASTHNNLGGVYGDQGNFEAAVTELRRAVAIVPKDPEYHINLASALAGTGHFREARVEVETALRLAPEDPNAREILQKLEEQR